MTRDYTAVSYARGETPPSTHEALAPAKHATLSGMVVEMDALALRLDKGLDVISAREEAGDFKGAEKARLLWEKLNQQWKDLYESYDDLLGPNKFGCIECRIKSGEQIDWPRVPVTARLCSIHALHFQADRARVRWPQSH